MEATAPVSTIAPEWIASFVDHGLYLRGWSLRTCRTYRQGLATLATTPLTKAGLAPWVRALRERGLIRVCGADVDGVHDFIVADYGGEANVNLRLLRDAGKGDEVTRPTSGESTRSRQISGS